MFVAGHNKQRTASDGRCRIASLVLQAVATSADCRRCDSRSLSGVAIRGVRGRRESPILHGRQSTPLRFITSHLFCKVNILFVGPE